MKFGPATIGETVEAIAFRARFRGTLMALRDGVASIAVLGYPEMLKVPDHAIVPVR